MRVAFSAIGFIAAIAATTVVAQGTPHADTARLQSIPNGDRVWVNGHWWPNPLRVTPHGALSTESAFGSALAAAGNAWTAALCQADSDGDGFTNGEELGDPSCVWTPGSTPTRATGITNPGLWSSVPSTAFPTRTQAYPAPSCARPTGLPSAAAERNALTATVAIPTYPGVNREAELATVRKPDTPDVFNTTGSAECATSLPGLLNWHDAATWGGRLPSAGTDVTLPSGASIVLTACSVPDAGFGRLTVPAGATLVLDDAPLHLRVKEIVVAGRLLAGGPGCPVESPLTVSFVAEKTESGSFNNGINVQGSGVVDLHGARRGVLWTRLRATVDAGSEVAVLQDEVDWSAGDEVVFATSIWKDTITDENEVRFVRARSSANASVVALDRPLQFKHYGGHEYQSEVALLTRSILLRSGLSASSHAAGYGGHTWAIGRSATYRMVGVRADRMGQRNVMARYPFHFHMMYAGGHGSYIQQCAVTNSYFRGYTIHGTNHTLVRKNVAFNTTGHTYYLEDGAEMLNTIEFNIAIKVNILGRPASGGSQSGETFIEDDEAILPADHAASGFYLSNAHNWVRGNAASGGWAGFSFPVFETTLKLSADIDLIPMAATILEFDGNTVHSSGHHWGDAGCIYAGGKLWLEGGRWRYTNGREKHPTRFPNGTIAWQQITNTRAWLCQKGYSSWGQRVDIRRFECHDCTRSAVLFGESSVTDAIVNAISDNRPHDMAQEGRQGFQFYDTWVQTMLVNVTFRNLYRVAGESRWSRSGVLVDLTHSDIFKPWGISAVRNIKFENVDRSMIFRRWVRESGASRMFNVLDWDGSLSNAASCQGQIIGSDIDWWNGFSDCRYDVEWDAWICPRRPGREVVGLDMELPGLQREMDVRPDSTTNLITPAEREQLYIGHVSYFGATGGAKRLIVTRNRHFATGLSNTAWYMYLSTGVPESIVVDPKNFPRGAYILLAISYPAGTTFEIHVRKRYGSEQRVDYREAASRTAVLASNGTMYHFDGRHLYLKVSDMYSEYPNAFSRGGVDIYNVQSTTNLIYVTASCPSRTGSNCAAPSEPDPPAELESGPELPSVQCVNMSQFTTPPSLCPAESDLPQTRYENRSCADLRSWECRAVLPTSCRRTCLPDCTRLAPYPYTCSLDRGCNAAEKPRPRIDWCAELSAGSIPTPACTVAYCNATANAIHRMPAPNGAECRNEDAGGQILDGRCLAGSGECVGTSQTDSPVRVNSADSATGSIVATVQVANGTVGTVTATFRVSHDRAPKTVTLTANAGAPHTYRGTVPGGGRVAGTVTLTVVTGNFGTRSLRVADWGRNSRRNPSVKVVSSTATSLVVRVDPLDFVTDVGFVASEDAANVVVRGAMAVGDLVTFDVPSGVPQGQGRVNFTFHDGMAMSVSLPCLRVDNGAACSSPVAIIAPKQASCAFRMHWRGSNKHWQRFEPQPFLYVGASAASVVMPGAARDGGDATFTADDGFSGGTGGTEVNRTVILVLSDGRRETFTLPVENEAGSLLPCVSGVAPPLDTIVPAAIPNAGVCVQQHCEIGSTWRPGDAIRTPPPQPSRPANFTTQPTAPSTHTPFPTRPGGAAGTTAPVEPSAPTTPSGRTVSFRGQFRLAGSFFQRFLADAVMRSRLRHAITADLEAILSVAASRITIDDMQLGSLVVDYSIVSSGSDAGDDVATAQANATLVASVGVPGTFPQTNSLYAQETNSTETLIMTSSSVQSGAVAVPPGVPGPAQDAEEEGACGTWCYVFIGGVVASVVLLVASAVSLYHHCASQAANPTKALPDDEGVTPEENHPDWDDGQEWDGGAKY